MNEQKHGCQFQNTWEIYTSSWKANSAEEKKAIFNKCLGFDCEYNDPSVKIQGWDALIATMQAFHQVVPGGHFETTYFLAHSDKSIARWNMKSSDDQIIGEGISYGEYTNGGKLISITGFFETPQ